MLIPILCCAVLFCGMLWCGVCSMFVQFWELAKRIMLDNIRNPGVYWYVPLPPPPPSLPAICTLMCCAVLLLCSM